MSGSDRDSSFSPDRYLFQSSLPHEVILEPSSAHTISSATIKAPVTVVSSPVAPVVNPCTVPLPNSPCSLSIRRIAKISKVDVEHEIKYWELSIVCYITSFNPPLHVIDGFVRRIWKALQIDKVGMVNRGVFFFGLH